MNFLTNDQKKRMSTLFLIKSMPENAIKIGLPQGKIRRLCRALMHQIDNRLRQLPQPDAAYIDEINVLFEEFGGGIALNCDGAAFCFKLLERTNTSILCPPGGATIKYCDQAVLNLLNSLSLYFDRGTENLVEKWDSLFF
ncbi:MAG: hypothetical protein HOJ48_01225 [Desulfobacula sp.]|jgi:hypothetical protein|nr:hypothetical protein [Desulfobacula sp.]MBT6337896.1 hypothetical protein [Desulfobacula sp.]